MEVRKEGEQIPGSNRRRRRRRYISRPSVLSSVVLHCESPLSLLSDWLHHGRVRGCDASSGCRSSRARMSPCVFSFVALRPQPASPWPCLLSACLTRFLFCFFLFLPIPSGCLGTCERGEVWWEQSRAVS